MRFLPTRVHGIIDYVWGIALAATPFLVGFSGHSAALWVAIAFGLGAIAYSALTDYEVGLVRLVPMPVHLVLDVVAGFALAVTPWLLGFAERIAWPFVAFGLFAVVAGFVTRTLPQA